MSVELLDRAEACADVRSRFDDLVPCATSTTTTGVTTAGTATGVDHQPGLGRARPPEVRRARVTPSQERTAGRGRL